MTVMTLSLATFIGVTAIAGPAISPSILRVDTVEGVAPAAFPVSVSEFHPSQIAWAALRQRVSSWAELGDDWDGDNGHPPRAHVLHAADQFILNGERYGVAIPSPFIEGDGEVGFRWRGADHFGSVAFLEDGSVVALVQVRGETILRLDEPVSAAKIHFLLKNLSTLA